MGARKAISLVFGAMISVGFLWLIFRSVPFAELVPAMTQADPAWLAVALGFFAFGYACRIWRWRLMLSHFNSGLTWRRCSVPFMVSIAANNVLPFRAGDVLRGVAFSGWLGVPTARVLATLLVERLLDLLALIAALALALYLFGTEKADVASFFGWSAVTFGALAGFVGLVLLFPGIFAPLCRWIVRALPNRGLAAKLERQFDHVFHTLATLAARTRMARLIVWSFFAWAFEAGVFYAIARSLPDITTPVAAWVAMPVGTLSTLLPSTPGYVGTFHFFVIQAAEALGNPAVAAAAFAFLVHLALLIPATLWGGASFVFWMHSRHAEAAPLSKVTSSQ